MDGRVKSILEVLVGIIPGEAVMEMVMAMDMGMDMDMEGTELIVQVVVVVVVVMDMGWGVVQVDMRRDTDHMEGVEMLGMEEEGEEGDMANLRD